MPDRHALLSASSSKQWLNCPPSARLQEQFPNESSVYAAEGTFAHEVCEYKVRKYLKERVKRPQSEEYYTEEIDQITDVYAEFVISIIEEMKRSGCEPLVMVEERVDYTHIAPSGFGTADMLIVGKDENGNGVLHIADFKTGQGVFVDADHNSQMMLYALGGLAAYGYIYDIKTVRMSIIQPRLDNISTFECTREELESWGESIRKIAILAYEGKGEQRAGDWCRFCRAKPVCKACKDEALSLCREEFLDLDEGAFNEGAFSDPPVVLESAGFCTEHSAKARSVGYEKEIAPTLRAGTIPAALSCFSNHSQDTRYTGPEEISQTISSTFGQGGNNQPFVVESRAFGICSTQSNAMKSDNPNSGFYEADTSRTIDTSSQSPLRNQGGMAVVQPIKNYDVRLTTEGTKNARSNVYETELARTIDTGGIAPNANQGGIAVVAVQGSMIGRKDESGPQGSGVNEDVSFTLNATDKHCVAYGIDRAAFNQGQNALYNFAVEEEIEPTMVAKGPGAVAQPTYCTSKASYHTRVNEEVAGTLVESDYKDPPVINDTDGIEYIVRRLTPSECAVLQGYDCDWCSDLGTENPTAEDIEYWREVFNEYNHAIGKSVKPKSDNQIIKWLKDPHSDSAEYSLWGNGLCKWCAVFVLSGIAYFDAHEGESA